MLLQCRLHISHPLVQTLTQLALTKVEFLKLIVGSFERAIIIEAAHSHLIDHCLPDQIFLRHPKISAAEGALSFFGDACLAKGMCTWMQAHGVAHHLLALEAVEMLGVGGVDELEFVGGLLLHFIDGTLDAANTSSLTHIDLAML